MRAAPGSAQPLSSRLQQIRLLHELQFPVLAGTTFFGGLSCVFLAFCLCVFLVPRVLFVFVFCFCSTFPFFGVFLLFSSLILLILRFASSFFFLGAQEMGSGTSSKMRVSFLGELGRLFGVGSKGTCQTNWGSKIALGNLGPRLLARLSVGTKARLFMDKLLPKNTHIFTLVDLAALRLSQ